MAKKTDDNVEDTELNLIEQEEEEPQIDYSVDQLEGVGAVTKKKLEASKYSLIIIFIDVLGLYRNSKIALFIIT